MPSHMNQSGKLGAARQALDMFLDTMRTPGGQAAVGGLAGGAAAYGAGEAFNAISPVDIDPAFMAGVGGSLGAMLGPQALRKAQARASAGKYGTQLGIPGL